MSNLTWKTVTDEMCCQGGIRRIVLDEKLHAKIGEGLTFSIPTGQIAPGARLKLFVGFDHTCPMELTVSMNGKECSYGDFGMESYAFLTNPALKPHTIIAYRACGEGADPTVTITGSPNGFITYLELKIG